MHAADLDLPVRLEETLDGLSRPAPRRRRGHRPAFGAAAGDLCEFVLGGGKRIRPDVRVVGLARRGRRPGRARRSTPVLRAVSRAGADPGVRARARRPHGRLRHPPRPPDRARRVRPQARRRGAGAAGPPGSAPRPPSCSATSPWSGPTTCCAAAGLRRRRRRARGGPVARRCAPRCSAGSTSTCSYQSTGDASRARGAADRPLQDRRVHRRTAAAPRRGARRRRARTWSTGYRRFGADIGVAFQLRDDLLGRVRRPGGDRQARGRRPARGQADAAARRSPSSGPTSAARRPRWPRSSTPSATRSSTTPASTAIRDLLDELGAVQAVEQRIAALTGSALDALGAGGGRRAGRVPAGRPGRRGHPAAPVRTVSRAAPTTWWSSARASPGCPPRCTCSAPGAASRSSSGPTTRAAAPGALDLETDRGHLPGRHRPDRADDADAARGGVRRRRGEARGAARPRRRSTPPTARASPTAPRSTSTPTPTRWRPRSGGSAGRTSAAGYGAAARPGSTQLYRAEIDRFIGANFDSPLGAARPGPGPAGARSAGSAGSRPRIARYLPDERLQRIFSFQALYAGVPPQRALGAYGVIAYMDTDRGRVLPAGRDARRSAGRWPSAAAGGRGARSCYGRTVTGLERSGGRVTAVRHRASAERRPDASAWPCDAVVLTPDLPVVHALLGRAPRRPVPLRWSPSAVVLHAGAAHALVPSWRTTRSRSARRGSGRSARSSTRAG